jgi:hypothetical protein
MAKSLGYYQYAGYIVRADIIDGIRWKNSQQFDLSAICTKLGLSLTESTKVCKAMGIWPKETPSKNITKRDKS